MGKEQSQGSAAKGRSKAGGLISNFKHQAFIAAMLGIDSRGKYLFPGYLSAYIRMAHNLARENNPRKILFTAGNTIGACESVHDMHQVKEVPESSIFRAGVLKERMDERAEVARVAVPDNNQHRLALGPDNAEVVSRTEERVNVQVISWNQNLTSATGYARSIVPMLVRDTPNVLVLAVQEAMTDPKKNHLIKAILGCGYRLEKYESFKGITTAKQFFSHKASQAIFIFFNEGFYDKEGEERIGTNTTTRTSVGKGFHLSAGAGFLESSFTEKGFVVMPVTILGKHYAFISVHAEASHSPGKREKFVRWMQKAVVAHYRKKMKFSSIFIMGDFHVRMPAFRRVINSQFYSKIKDLGIKDMSAYWEIISIIAQENGWDMETAMSHYDSHLYTMMPLTSRGKEVSMEFQRMSLDPDTFGKSLGLHAIPFSLSSLPTYDITNMVKASGSLVDIGPAILRTLRKHGFLAVSQEHSGNTDTPDLEPEAPLKLHTATKIWQSYGKSREPSCQYFARAYQFLTGKTAAPENPIRLLYMDTSSRTLKKSKGAKEDEWLKCSYSDRMFFVGPSENIVLPKYSHFSSETHGFHVNWQDKARYQLATKYWQLAETKVGELDEVKIIFQRELQVLPINLVEPEIDMNNVSKGRQVYSDHFPIVATLSFVTTRGAKNLKLQCGIGGGVFGIHDMRSGRVDVHNSAIYAAPTVDAPPPPPRLSPSYDHLIMADNALMRGNTSPVATDENPYSEAPTVAVENPYSETPFGPSAEDNTAAAVCAEAGAPPPPRRRGAPPPPPDRNASIRTPLPPPPPPR